MKTLILLGLLLFSSSLLSSDFDHSHSLFSKVLNKVVIDKGAESKVNYTKLKTNQGDLKTYLDALSGVSKGDYKSLTQDQRLAFLINAYNAFTLKLIIDNYPVDSIKDIGGFFSSPWKKRFFKLLDEKMHLDQIEHEIIRKDFNEPRIHFAVVCASIGCPKLHNTAYTASNLDSKLELATKQFLKDSTRNRYNRSKNEFQVSKIFDWYDENFGDTLSLKRFLNKHMQLGLSTDKLKKASLSYLDYDWSLNDYKGKK
ncbi:MAG: hypothetical protein CME64_01020 [Halobacteriovoraceae bacterium]|nr:hypothetical protein [Halobacteriovoraceae bacterium]|tara:strand:+ start:222699 stop:223466 length:768 start_codon:yes stop_codon:yes gene_type:complete